MPRVTHSPFPCGPAATALVRLARLARLAACLLCSIGLHGAAAASEADDPVLRLLLSRGLVAAAPMPAPAAAGPAADATSQLVLAAMNFLDIDYRYGGSSARDGFDCSGFTRHVYATALGVVLPRRSDAQAREPSLRAVEGDALQPGDLVFFNTLRRAFSHVGLYIGDGRFVHAPRSGAQVRVESMRTSYWARRFDGARRLGAASAPAAAAAAATGATGVAGVADGPIDGWVSPH